MYTEDLDYFLEQVQQPIVSHNESILDEPMNNLSQDVWEVSDNEEAPTLKSWVRKYIIEGVEYVASGYPVENIYFVGSMTGYRYTDDSDIDITIVVDADEGTVEELAERARMINEQPLPETKHPVNYFVVNSNFDMSRFDSSYEIYTESWVKPPQDFGVDVFNVYDDFKNYVSQLDVDKEEAKRAVVDIQMLRDAIDRGGDISILSNKIQQRINKLDEVVILPYDLTGVLKEDIESVEVFNPDMDAIYFGVDDISVYEFSDDQYSKVENYAAMNQNDRIRYQANGVAIVEGLVNLIFKPKKKSKNTNTETEKIPTQTLADKYQHDYYTKNFNIPEEQVEAFIAFVQKNDFDVSLLEKGNEMQLIEDLNKRSKKFLRENPVEKE